MSFHKLKPAVSGLNSGETEINRILKQVSDSSSIREKKPRRSYSFLINKHLKKFDSDPKLKNYTTYVPGRLSVDLAPSSDKISTTTNHSYLFNRHSSTYASFMNRNFIKTKSSLEI